MKLTQENLEKRNNLVDRYITSGNWKGLEGLLLEKDTPLDPYWRCLDRFPAGFNLNKLLDGLWNNQGRNEYFKTLQREGETKYALYVLDKFKNQYGLVEFDNTLFEIYVDIVHLSGDYKKAVELYDDYLSKYSKDAIYHDQTLAHYKIRMIHHSMFFKPVKPLIKDALEVYNHSNKLKESDVNELLFLIGGNLGVLSGDLEFASKWLNKGYEMAKKSGNKDAIARYTRKRADILIANGKTKDALNLVEELVTLDRRIESRYQVYLLGTLGEAYKAKGDYNRARMAFTELLTIAKEKGLAGWEAHAYLALANLAYDYTTDAFDLEFAMENLKKASRLYKTVGQAWGSINAVIVKNRLLSKLKGVQGMDVDELGQAINQANNLGYSRESKVLREMKAGKVTHKYQLFFL